MASRNNLRNAFFDRLQVNDLQIVKNLTVSDNAEVDLNGENWDFIVVGCGVAGLWGARKLAINNPDKSILIIASGERINQETFYNNYAPDRGISLNSDKSPTPSINTTVMNKKPNPDLKSEIESDYAYSPIGGNTLINGSELTLDKVYLPEDLQYVIDEIEEVIKPIMEVPLSELNIPDNTTKNLFTNIGNIINNSLDPNIVYYRSGMWINKNEYFSGPRYDPYKFILDENGNKFENINILENTYVHNLILDTNGRCLGTRNLSTPNTFVSNSLLNNNGKLLLAGGYLGTTQVLSNLKQTIPRHLSSKLSNMGTQFSQVPSFFLLNLIPNLKDEYKFSNLPNTFVNGPSYPYRFNGNDNLGENGIIGIERITIPLAMIELLGPIIGIDFSKYSKTELDLDKEFTTFISYFNPGIKYNQYFDLRENTLDYTNKNNDLTNFAFLNAFTTNLNAKPEPTLDTPNFFNAVSNYTYFRWKSDTPEYIIQECYDNLHKLASNFINVTKNMVKTMSEPGSTNELASYFKINISEFPPVKGGLLEPLLEDKEKFINDFILQFANHNYHICSGNSQFVDPLTNKLNISENVFLGDQSVFEHHVYTGAWPNSSAVCSMAMAEKAVTNM